MESTTQITPWTLSEKELKDQDLVALHRSVLKDYLNKNLNWESKDKSKLMKLYDKTIDRSNIRHYFNHHVGIFIIALIQDKLSSIATYTHNLTETEEDDE